jgi:ubiquinone/menaquinone biosynthesis C-methylase UbiE
MQIARRQLGRFQGVSQILIYNWHFYVAALAADLLIILLLISFPHTICRPLLWLIAIPPTFWAVSSILVSHYVYDRSALYRWEWLSTVLDNRAEIWLNIHAGLDQTTVPLSRIFPAAQIKSIDIYTPYEMSEPSIARARHRAQPTTIHEIADATALPFADSACDAVLVIFAAHELRSHDAKFRLFRELHRVLKPDGRIVLVEHLRDWRNFLAYGPGFFHFFSARVWCSVASQAELNGINERSVTPFVKCFVLGKSDESAPRHTGPLS